MANQRSSRGKGGAAKAPVGPSQRQLRAGELIRHALVEILREEELSDPALEGVSITISEARMSPDLRHATVFVEPLGAGLAEEKAKNAQAEEVVAGLNRVAKFIRGRLSHHIDAKFTPDLKFRRDDSFDNAAAIDKLFDDPRVRADLDRFPDPDGVDDGA